MVGAIGFSELGLLLRRSGRDDRCAEILAELMSVSCGKMLALQLKLWEVLGKCGDFRSATTQSQLT